MKYNVLRLELPFFLAGYFGNILCDSHKLLTFLSVFRTALMLGCEYGCRDAVEVLVKNGADVTLLDALGHDSSYYARIGDNLDILNILKTASENTNTGAGRFL